MKISEKAMQDKICTLIVDDELLARKALHVLLSTDPDIEIVAECGSGIEAIARIRMLQPDLVFLDIEMPDADGFQVIREIGVEKMPLTIFVTAYDKYAVRAFHARALDYLLKPFDHERFEEALLRVKKQIHQQKLGSTSEKLLALLGDMNVAAKNPAEQASGAEKTTRLAIKSGGRIYFIKTDEIDWVEATGDYVRLHVGNKAHLMHETMNGIHARLDHKTFFRIHRSSVVNIERVRDIQPLFKGEYIITLTSGVQIKSSRGYRQQLQKVLDEAR